MHARRVVTLAAAAAACGYTIGEKPYFIGTSETILDGGNRYFIEHRTASRARWRGRGRRPRGPADGQIP